MLLWKMIILEQKSRKPKTGFPYSGSPTHNLRGNANAKNPRASGGSQKYQRLKTRSNCINQRVSPHQMLKILGYLAGGQL